MQSLRILTRKNTGFTLIEILVVISIFATLGTISLIVSLDTYRGYMFRNERDLIIVSLTKARNQSMNNICIGACTAGKPHGVEFLPDKLVVFQGVNYAARDVSVDEIIPRQYNNLSSIPGSPSEVEFAQLSGDVAAPGWIAITDGKAHVSTTTISAEGRITWTN